MKSARTRPRIDTHSSVVVMGGHEHERAGNSTCYVLEKTLWEKLESYPGKHPCEFAALAIARNIIVTGGTKTASANRATRNVWQQFQTDRLELELRLD